MRCKNCGAETGHEEWCASNFVEALPPPPPPSPPASKKTNCCCLAPLVIAGLVVAGVVWIAFSGDKYPNRNAQKTKSLNNIKQLATAATMYAADYNDTFPGWVRNPDGRYAHNVWDEQISAQLKAKGAFNNGDTGIKSYSQAGTHDRVPTYGLNGLLITPSKADFDGDADFGAVNAKNPPTPLTPGAIGDPSGTILLAELSTSTAMPGVYGQEPDPKPYTYAPGTQGELWKKALPGWIDISPRAFIEIARGWRTNPYQEPYGRNADSGVARDLYSGGGVYAFADGHAKFMKIGMSVGLGTTTRDGMVITDKNCWSPKNTNNMWNPR